MVEEGDNKFHLACSILKNSAGKNFSYGAQKRKLIISYTALSKRIFIRKSSPDRKVTFQHLSQNGKNGNFVEMKTLSSKVLSPLLEWDCRGECFNHF